MTKPRTAAGYGVEQVANVRATCLYLATKLGDLLDDIVVVGGLVPSLIIDQAQQQVPHVGTMDLDLGLALALLEGHRYEALTARLREAGFAPDTNEKGNPTHQRWKIDGAAKVTLDFLIPPSKAADQGGRLRHLQYLLNAHRTRGATQQCDHRHAVGG